MFERQICNAADTLKKYGCSLKYRLSESQIREAQAIYNTIFPPDLVELFLTFIPDPFYNWGNMARWNVEDIKKRIHMPIEGILFDIRSNNFWLKKWGVKPDRVETAEDIAKRNLCNVPPLIPLYSHRYIPSCPSKAGNPVYSFWHANDMIYYGTDLWDYIEVEFGHKSQISISFDKKEMDIPFWGEIVS